jgi:hypothetical protein
LLYCCSLSFALVLLLFVFWSLYCCSLSFGRCIVVLCILCAILLFFFF